MFATSLVYVLWAATWLIPKVEPANVAIYANKSKVRVGDDVALIVELTNRMSAPIRISSEVEYDKLDGKEAIPDRQFRTPAAKEQSEPGRREEGVWQLRCRITVRDGISRDRFVGLSGPRELRVEQIKSGGTAMIKCPIPKAAFEPGECVVEVLLCNAERVVARSQQIPIAVSKQDRR